MGVTIVSDGPIPPPKRDAAAVPRPTLTAEQQDKEAFVLNHFAAEGYVLPGVEEDKQVLMEEERYFLTKECLLRYLRATKWDEKAAVNRLEATLQWRREFGLYDQMTPEYIEPEGITGKEIVFGYDVDGRPALYMLPSRQNTEGVTPEGQRKQLQFAIWTMERAFDLLPLGVESVALMIDFADKAKKPSMSTSRLMLDYLQNHYPERLGRAFIINLPYLVTLFFKLVMPFIDPVTREKIKFNPDVLKAGYFTPEQLTTSWGGYVEIPYKHDVYWPRLLKVTGDRRQEQLEKWRAMGATIGISEYDLRQEDVVLVVAPEEQEVAQEATTPVESEKTPETPPAVEVTSVVA